MSSTFIDTQEWIPIHTLPGYEACIEYYINRNGDVKSSKGSVERILKHINITLAIHQLSLRSALEKVKYLQFLCTNLLLLRFLINLHYLMARKLVIAVLIILMKIN